MADSSNRKLDVGRRFVSGAPWLHLSFLLYIGSTAFTSFHHELWRDETQAWLIARDLPLKALFAQANYEGSPMLWHLLLAPLAKSGLPAFSMQVIHLSIAYGIAYLVLYRSSLPVLTRVLFVFSYYMFWEYAILARSYSLSILILFVLGVLYRNRLKQPLLYACLIALLFNSNVHSVFIAIGLGCVFVFDIIRAGRESVWLPVVVVMGGFLVAVLQLLPADDNMNRAIAHIFEWKRPVIALSNAFFPYVPRTAYLSSFAAMLIVSVAGYHLFETDRRLFFVIAMGYLGVFYIFVFKHVGTLRHHGFLLIWLMFAMGLASVGRAKSGNYIDKATIALLNLCFILSIFFAGRHHYNEYRYSFSGAQAAATYINDHLGPSPIIVAHPSIKASALAPHLSTGRLWYADVEAFGTYITWNEAYAIGKELDASAVLEKAELKFAASGEAFLYVTDRPLPDTLQIGYNLLYKTEEVVFGYGEERYYLYRRR